MISLSIRFQCEIRFCQFSLYRNSSPFGIMQQNQIQLNLSAIHGIPIDKYDKNFTFIVNNEEFKISLIGSDLLSPKITKIHAVDPTFDTFVINTTQPGHFSYLLNLINFEPIDIPENELPFISEVIEILENESIQLLFESDSIELTEDNVFKEISQHEKNSKFYSKQLLSEIEFISSHFHELLENHEEELGNLEIETLLKILTNSNLKLRDEDQLLNFVNHLYVNDKQFAVLYETVCFANASSECVSEFVNVYDINDITQAAWSQISTRFIHGISSPNDRGGRYTIKRILFPYQSGNEFSGIINYLNSQCNGNIDNAINFTASSNDWSSGENYKPHSVAFFNDSNKFFVSGKHQENEWLCLDFKEHKIIPTHYTIKSTKYEIGNWHPKSWVIEVSNDNKNWIEIDKQQNCSHLNGPYYTHTFSISKKQVHGFQYIRMRQLEAINGLKYLAIDSFEIYGSLI